ncbi:MAG: hypothetical protein WD424_03615, partial [Paenibacillaceae bacterium]
MRKKKTRWKRILLWSSLGLAIMLIASLFVLDYAVDKVLRSMSGMDTIMNELEAVESTDVSPENAPDVTDNPAGGQESTPGETTGDNETVEQSDQQSDQ